MLTESEQTMHCVGYYG